MTLENALDGVEEGRRLFSGACEFIWAAASSEGLPPIGPAEVAFCGRSNVGKSSLINALTGRKMLARTSRSPGRTQELNFFALSAQPPHERLRVVDMPGYGYAAASKEKVSAWTKLIRAYLRGRSSLARVYILVDGRHGLKESDLDMCDLLDRAAVSYQLVLTKRDEVKKSEQESRIAEVLQGLAKHPAAYPEVLFTSSRTGEDVATLRASIALLLRQRGA